jgi:hypothetical protein
MEMLDANAPSALALYHTLTQSEAPATLITAHARTTTAMHQAVADANAGRIRIEEAPAADTTLASSALTSAEFRDRYCKSPSDWDYVACLTNYDAAFSVGRLGVSLGCRVQGQRGRTLMVHQTWYPFSWSSVSFMVDPQEIFYTRTYGFFTARKCAALPLPSPSEPNPRYDVSAWGDNI